MADKALEQVARWRISYPAIEITEAALLTMAPFASLYASDFLVYAEGKGQLPADVIQFFRDLHRELVWVYGNWQKAQRDADPAVLFRDILTNARQGAGGEREYAFLTKFMLDYAKANNFNLDQREIASWEATFGGGGEVISPVLVGEGAGDAKA